MKSMAHVLFGVLLILVALAVAQESKPSGNGAPKYDNAQERKFSGVIQEVKDYQCPVTGTFGTHISVKGDVDTIEVHLAPAKFLKEYEIMLKPGDPVTVTGVQFAFDGKPAMLAKEVVIDRMRYTFRNSKGQPLW